MNSLLLILISLSAYAAGDDVTAQLKTCLESPISSPNQIKKSLKCENKKAFAAKVRANAKSDTEKELAQQIATEADNCFQVIERLNKSFDRTKFCTCLKTEIEKASGMAAATNVKLNSSAMKDSAQIKCALQL